MAQYHFHCTGVITGLTESFGIIFLMAEILLNSSFVSVTEFYGGGVRPVKNGFQRWCVWNVPKVIKQFTTANGCLFGQSIMCFVHLQEDSILDRFLCASFYHQS
jgi:hypothetical protein